MGRYRHIAVHYDGFNEETKALRGKVTKATKLVVKVKHGAHVGV